MPRPETRAAALLNLAPQRLARMNDRRPDGRLLALIRHVEAIRSRRYRDERIAHADLDRFRDALGIDADAEAEECRRLDAAHAACMRDAEALIDSWRVAPILKPAVPAYDRTKSTRGPASARCADW